MGGHDKRLQQEVGVHGRASRHKVGGRWNVVAVARAAGAGLRSRAAGAGSRSRAAMRSRGRVTATAGFRVRGAVVRGGVAQSR